MLPSTILEFRTMRNIHRHMDEEELEQYSLGTADSETNTALEEHLLICERCREQLQNTDQHVLAMRSAAQHQREMAERKRRFWEVPLWVPALAAVACGLVIMIAVRAPGTSPQPAVAVSLTAMRDSGRGSSAPRGRDLLVYPGLTGLAPAGAFRLEVVTDTGRMVRQVVLDGGGAARVPGLDPGTYFVRLSTSSGELLREYALTVR